MQGDQGGGAAPVLAVEGLHKAFGGHPVLRGVELVLRRGEALALVGGSGCGKTVLLAHVLGQLTPDRGRVRVAIAGPHGAALRDLAGLPEAEIDALHRRWGVVFQRNALFSGSVLDNLALGLREVLGLDEAAVERRAVDALAAVGLAHDAEFLDSDQERLSGGMAKRLAVARALAMDPEVLFYDEPTTGLDPTSSAQIHELIASTHRHTGRGVPRTTFIITHDKDLLYRLRPRTVMLHEGRVLYDGPFEGFAASEEPAIRPYFDRMPVLHGLGT